jgi:hypothetical protein
MKNLVLTILLLFIGCSIWDEYSSIRKPPQLRSLPDLYWINKEFDCIPIDSFPLAHPDNLQSTFHCEWHSKDGIFFLLRCIDPERGTYLKYHYVKGYEKCLEITNQVKQKKR